MKAIKSVLKRIAKILPLLLVPAALVLGAGLPYLAAAWQDRAYDGAEESGEISEIQLSFRVPPLEVRAALAASGEHLFDSPSRGTLTEETALEAAEAVLAQYARTDALAFLSQPHSAGFTGKYLAYNTKIGASALFWEVIFDASGGPNWHCDLVLDDVTGKLLFLTLSAQAGLLFQEDTDPAVLYDFLPAFFDRFQEDLGLPMEILYLTPPDELTWFDGACLQAALMDPETGKQGPLFLFRVSADFLSIEILETVSPEDAAAPGYESG